MPGPGFAQTMVAAALAAAWYTASDKEEGVPDFGKLSFLNVELTATPFGSFASSGDLDRWNRFSGTGKLQIKAGNFASNNKDFDTVFKHS